MLGGVNELTKDRIYAINNAATIAAYSAVLEAESYDEETAEDRYETYWA